MSSNKEVAKKLRQLRGEKSRKEVATALHISTSALAMYENGARVPRDDIKILLARYYGTTVGAIFFGQ